MEQSPITTTGKINVNSVNIDISNDSSSLTFKDEQLSEGKIGDIGTELDLDDANFVVRPNKEVTESPTSSKLDFSKSDDIDLDVIKSMIMTESEVMSEKNIHSNKFLAKNNLTKDNYVEDYAELDSFFQSYDQEIFSQSEEPSSQSESSKQVKNLDEPQSSSLNVPPQPTTTPPRQPVYANVIKPSTQAKKPSKTNKPSKAKKSEKSKEEYGIFGKLITALFTACVLGFVGLVFDSIILILRTLIGDGGDILWMFAPFLAIIGFVMALLSGEDSGINHVSISNDQDDFSASAEIIRGIIMATLMFVVGWIIFTIFM